MAEEKKEDKKEEKKDAPKEEGSSHEISGWVVIGAALLLMLVVARVGNIDTLIERYFTVSYFLSLIPEPIKEMGRDLAFAYVIFATALSLFLLVALVYTLIKMIDVEREWDAIIYPTQTTEVERVVKNHRWELVMKHISSDNPSDWRLSILEADIILDELLDSLGYVGDTIGDKLQKANKGDFRTLDEAWEAHKIRNAIAHEGQHFELTQREAQRIITLYRTVFEEFDYI